MLIAAHADPLIQDIRGRDALYWAALQPNGNTFAKVLEEMDALKASPSRFLHAVSAATAVNNSDFVRKLLKNSYFWNDHTDQDGWTAAYTALSYDRESITSLIAQAVKTTGRPKRDRMVQLKLSTEWHPADMSGYLTRQPDNMSIKVEREFILPAFILP
ncbi:hypothetical protein F4782DRAFT_515310 [Xylaria castorea]|nr:hypothetical protein F4782DRAFT_515310 [Xylaria castorea]